MKKFWLSKTMWTNTLAGIAVAIQSITGVTWFNPEAQAAIIVILNMILRAVTKEGLTA